MTIGLVQSIRTWPPHGETALPMMEEKPIPFLESLIEHRERGKSLPPETLEAMEKIPENSGNFEAFFQAQQLAYSKV